MPGPEALPAVFTAGIFQAHRKFGLTAEAETRSDFTATVEQVTDPKQAERLLEIWRKADHVSPVGLAGLERHIGDMPDWGEHHHDGGAVLRQVPGDWNGLLEVLFSADIRKASHNVKDLMRALLENQLPAEGFLLIPPWRPISWTPRRAATICSGFLSPIIMRSCPSPSTWTRRLFSMLGDVAQAEAALDSYAVAVDALYGTLSARLRELGLKTSLSGQNCLFAGCWQRWNSRAAGWTKERWSPSGRC